MAFIRKPNGRNIIITEGIAMNLYISTMRKLLSASFVCLLIAPIVTACAKSPAPVSVHGVNYSGETFSYVVTDPRNAKNTAGGELIEPYAAGGTMCCYELPKKWRPGLTISIQSTHWVGKLDDNTLRDVATTHLVEIPRYSDGKPGEIWVLRAGNGSMSVISSDFQPDHPKWPGQVKGWPVPSLEHQRTRWGLYINHQKQGVAVYEDLISELNSSPEVRARDAWDFALKNDKDTIKGYTGPEDEKYRESLRRRYEDGLMHAQRQLQQLEQRRP
jgi:hypothetical protein